jgi:Protein of unknown function (DUF2398)
MEAAQRHMRRLIGEHKAHWRKDARDPGADRELTVQAVHRLAALGLIERSGEEIRPLPALARFGYAPPKIIGKAKA